MQRPQQRRIQLLWLQFFKKQGGKSLGEVETVGMSGFPFNTFAYTEIQ